MNAAPANSQRDTIELVDGQVVSQRSFPGEQFILTVTAPEVAQRATPGSFAHLRCASDIPMRRPLSIMRADKRTGELQFLYKLVGSGLQALSRLTAGDHISVLGPIGNGFSTSGARPKRLLVGGGVGIPPMIFLAEQLSAAGAADEALVLMGSEVPFPFTLQPAKQPVAGMPESATHALADLEQLPIRSRLASLQGYAGAHTGYVTELAAGWLSSLTAAERDQVDMFACGPEPMLAAAAKVAAAFDVPCQLSLEEYMACAVGGCAGCTVAVHGADGLAMKRVCVDGPVFPATAIYPG